MERTGCHIRKSVLSVLLALVFLCLVLAGCTTTQPAPPVQTTATPPPTPNATPNATHTPTTRVTTVPTVPITTELTGTRWQLVSYQGPQLSAVNVLPGSIITARFGKDENVTGSAGCNQYGASYKATPGSVSIGPVTTTMMACDAPTGVMTQESVYLVNLGKASTFTVHGDLLTLYDSGGKTVLTFTRSS